MVRVGVLEEIFLRKNIEFKIRGLIRRKLGESGEEFSVERR